MSESIASDSSDFLYKTNPIRLLEKPSFTVKGHSFTNPFYEGKFYLFGSRVNEVRFQIQKLGGQMSTFYSDSVSHVILPDDVYSWFEVHKQYADHGLAYWLGIPQSNLTESSLKILHSVALKEKRVWKVEKVERWIRFLKIDRDTQPAAKRSHSMSFEENNAYKKMRTDSKWKPITNNHYYAFVCENSGNYKPIISKVYHKITEKESQSPQSITQFHSKSNQTPFIEPSSVSEAAEFDDNESGYTRLKSNATSIHSRKSLPNMKRDTNSLIKEASSNRLNTSNLLTPSQSVLHPEDKTLNNNSSSEIDLDLSSVGSILSDSASEGECFESDELSAGVSRKYHNITSKEGYCELCGERYKDFIKV